MLTFRSRKKLLTLFCCPGIFYVVNSRCEERSSDSQLEKGDPGIFFMQCKYKKLSKNGL